MKGAKILLKNAIRICEQNNMKMLICLVKDGRTVSYSTEKEVGNFIDDYINSKKFTRSLIPVVEKGTIRPGRTVETSGKHQSKTIFRRPFRTKLVLFGLPRPDTACLANVPGRSATTVFSPTFHEPAEKSSRGDAEARRGHGGCRWDG